jgi:hypothetical protein
MEHFQIQQKSLNGFSWFVVGLSPTLSEALECATAMYEAYKPDAPWLELRVVEPVMPSYIRN